MQSHTRGLCGAQQSPVWRLQGTRRNRALLSVKFGLLRASWLRTVCCLLMLLIAACPSIFLTLKQLYGIHFSPYTARLRCTRGGHARMLASMMNSLHQMHNSITDLNLHGDTTHHAARSSRARGCAFGVLDTRQGSEP
jgi:hypothetical protein